MQHSLSFPRIAQKTLSFLFFFMLAATVFGQQASISVQGVLTKSDGTAVDDGDYSLTFKLWTAPTGGTAVHNETISAVETIGGVYSVVLGASSTPITAPFNQTYYLGVSVGGGTELSPRPQLTHAPYALALVGSSNSFPGSGTVGIGTSSPTAGNELHVKDGSAGARLLVEGATTSEVAVKGSTTSKLTVESNNGSTIELKKGANTATITYDGTSINISNLNLVLNDDINLPVGKTVKYNGLSDWRLVDTDDFSTGNDEWACYLPLSTTPRTFERFSPNTPFSEGFILRPNQSGGDLMKKQFNLTGIPHTRVKVVFTYHFFDSWTDSEWGFAAVANDLNAVYGQNDGRFQIGWHKPYGFSTFGHFSGSGYVHFNNTTPSLDYNVRAEMIFQDSGNAFWVYFGSVLDQAATDESYGISDIEIWVK